ncbi:hypothetical protein Pint_01310 [Pistacia integerrima]|uniref:Uncharacterized protein n=1 Tax=Pistacia integerrima TaxID=434235 RepID=A0ACC0ZG90_9ROSI|nr:hypothetical protein Pint_01310 [Pistacia integerrima]
MISVADLVDLEYEKRLNKALEQEEKDKRKKIVEQEEKDKRFEKVVEQEEKDRRLKKVAEQEEKDKRLNKVTEQEQKDKRLKKVAEQEENDKKWKEEYEKRLNKALEQEEKDKRKKVIEQEEKDKRFEKVVEQEEKDRRLKKVAKQEEKDKRLNKVAEQEQKDKRLKKLENWVCIAIGGKEYSICAEAYKFTGRPLGFWFGLRFVLKRVDYMLECVMNKIQTNGQVENQSGLNLQCLFYNQQSVIVGRKQFASIFFRSFTTSSINLSLLEARSFAWRTKILSAQEENEAVQLNLNEKFRVESTLPLLGEKCLIDSDKDVAFLFQQYRSEGLKDIKIPPEEYYEDDFHWSDASNDDESSNGFGAAGNVDGEVGDNDGASEDEDAVSRHMKARKMKPTTHALEYITTQMPLPHGLLRRWGFIRSHKGSCVKPLDAELGRVHFLEIHKRKLFRARRLAIGMTQKQHAKFFAWLFKYNHILQITNSRSMIELRKEDFWEGCRHFIGIDGCHLKGHYGGVVSKAANIPNFVETMGSVKDVNEGAYKWLLENEPDQWSKHAFNTTTKLKVGIEWITPLPPVVRRKINKMIEAARNVKVWYLGSDEFEVDDENANQCKTHVLVLGKQLCDCGMWQLSGIPCVHAIAYLLHKNISNYEHYVDSKLRISMYLQTYAYMVHPVPDKTSWPEVSDEYIWPPYRQPKRIFVSTMTAPFSGARFAANLSQVFGSRGQPSQECNGEVLLFAVVIVELWESDETPADVLEWVGILSWRDSEWDKKETGRIEEDIQKSEEWKIGEDI